MLHIIDNLQPFFKDCYKRIGVREYARLKKLSPPTASKLLSYYHKEGLLKKEQDRQYHYYYADKDSRFFRKLSVIYWQIYFKDLLEHIEHNSTEPVIVLFGSFAKAEVHPESDIDLAVFTPKQEIAIQKFEKKLKRNIQLFLFRDLDDVKDRNLLRSILNGEKLRGSW